MEEVNGDMRSTRAPMNVRGMLLQPKVRVDRTCGTAGAYLCMCSDCKTLTTTTTMPIDEYIDSAMLVDGTASTYRRPLPCRAGCGQVQMMMKSVLPSGLSTHLSHQTNADAYCHEENMTVAPLGSQSGREIDRLGIARSLTTTLNVLEMSPLRTTTVPAEAHLMFQHPILPHDIHAASHRHGDRIDSSIMWGSPLLQPEMHPVEHHGHSHIDITKKKRMLPRYDGVIHSPRTGNIIKCYRGGGKSAQAASREHEDHKSCHGDKQQPRQLSSSQSARRKLTFGDTSSAAPLPVYEMHAIDAMDGGDDMQGVGIYEHALEILESLCRDKWAHPMAIFEMSKIASRHADNMVPKILRERQLQRKNAKRQRFDDLQQHDAAAVSARELSKRRFYDVMNVLVGLNVVTRVDHNKKRYIWINFIQAFGKSPPPEVSSAKRRKVSEDTSTTVSHFIDLAEVAQELL